VSAFRASGWKEVCGEAALDEKVRVLLAEEKSPVVKQEMEKGRGN
jgi:hypothetical protein